MEGESKNVKTIEKAFKILMLFDWNHKELTLTEIAKNMNMAKSTASRLLNTIVDMGFLCKDETNNKYYLGGRIYYLGQVAKENVDIRKICRPYLERLTQVTMETSHVYEFREWERICIDQVISPQPIKQSVKVGSTEPIWYGASGKAILAFMDHVVWEKAAKLCYPQGTDKEIKKYVENLQVVREQGYALRDNVQNDTVGCIAAPIFGVRGEVVASIAISTPGFRFPKNYGQYVEHVCQAAKGISSELGFVSESK